MNDLLEVYRRIAPELVEVVEERYSILSHISHAQPVGRRMLASLCNLSERSVRSHIELMRDNGLVDLMANNGCQRYLNHSTNSTD